MCLFVFSLFVSNRIDLAILTNQKKKITLEIGNELKKSNQTTHAHTAIRLTLAMRMECTLKIEHRHNSPLVLRQFYGIRAATAQKYFSCISIFVMRPSNSIDCDCDCAWQTNFRHEIRAGSQIRTNLYLSPFVSVR